MSDDRFTPLFKTALREHAGIVLKVSRAYSRTAEDCQDLAQEILLQIWRSMASFEERSSLSTWLYRVAINTALSWKRQEHRARGQHRTIIEVEDLAAEGIDGTQQAIQRETVDQLYAAIHQLPETDAALILLYLDDKTYREMAEVLGISETYVGVKLNRAKKSLGELLKETSDASR